MKLSVLKQLIKEEFLREIKLVKTNEVYVSPDASGTKHQHLIDLFNEIIAKNKDLTGIYGFIDLGKNIDVYMKDALAGISDEDKEELSEIPVLVMKKGPYEVIFGFEEDYDYYYLSFVKNGQLDNNPLLRGVEGNTKLLIQTPLIASYLNTGEAEY